MAALAEVAESVADPQRYHDVNVRRHGGRGRGGRWPPACRPPRLLLDGRRLRRARAHARSTRTTRSPRPTPTARPSSPGSACWAGGRASGGRLATSRCATSTPAAPTAPRGEDHDPETHLIPLALARRPRRHAAPGLRRRLPHAGRHLRPRLRPRRATSPTPTSPRSSACRGVQGVQPRHGQRRLRARGAAARSRSRPAAAARSRRSPPRRRPARARGPSDRARRRAGLAPRRSLDDAVADAWAWMSDHPRGYDDRDAGRETA